jgi:hypothetical protein
VESPFDILQKIDDVNFLWIEEVGDLRTAIARIEELQARKVSDIAGMCLRSLQPHEIRVIVPNNLRSQVSIYRHVDITPRMDIQCRGFPP